VRQISIFSLIFYILSLALPSQTVFAANSGGSSAAASKPILAIQTVIKVVSVTPSAAQIQIAEQATSLAACQLQVAKSADILQDANLINLNQPGSCFALQVSESARQFNLSVVKQQPALAKIIVVDKNTQIAPYNFAPHTQNSSLPILPLAVYALGISFYAWEKNLSARKLKPFNSLKTFLTFHRLEVLRC